MQNSYSGCFWSLTHTPIVQYIPDVGLQLKHSSIKQSFCIAKFLRTPILKNICERLRLKISTSVTNFLFLFKLILSILNFTMTEWFFHVTCFAKVSLLLLKRLENKNCNIFMHKEVTHIKWDVIIPSWLRTLLKEWIWYRCQNRKLLSPWWRIIIIKNRFFIKKSTY